MNDFTKEELKYIFYCVDLVTHKNDDHDIYGKLENKLESMIVNYCEHKDVSHYYTGLHCYTCGKVWNLPE